jgi:zinc transporter, ZIP family
MQTLAAGFWGFVGGVSLLIGALLGLYAGASQRVISIVMAIGAGVLISSVAFELMDEAYKAGGFDAASFGLLLGALLYFVADWAGANTASARRASRREGLLQRSP